jgi:hypothetical protein
MLYLFHGQTITEPLKKARRFVDLLVEKKPNIEVIQPKDFNSRNTEELISTQGLFEKTLVVFLTRYTQENEDFRKDLKEFSESENIFILVEENLKKKDSTSFEKLVEKIFECKGKNKTKTEKKRGDIFALTDALGNRDKKKLWVLFSKAKRDNISAEEILGLLFWQIRTMCLANTCSLAKEAGLKDFVFSKAKRFSRNYSEEESLSLASSLLSGYHRARMGGPEMLNFIEKLILDL